MQGRQTLVASPFHCKRYSSFAPVLLVAYASVWFGMSRWVITAASRSCISFGWHGDLGDAGCMRFNREIGRQGGIATCSGLQQLVTQVSATATMVENIDVRHR